MPRTQVYVTQNSYKRIEAIVDEKKKDGADRSEANISSVAAMLLDIGLRVYEFQQKKETQNNNVQNENDEQNLTQEKFNRTLMENVLKTSYASTILLQMLGKIEEVEKIDSFNFEKIREDIKEKTVNQLDEIFEYVSQGW